jgi:Tfp pilus assembly protein FimT
MIIVLLGILAVFVAPQIGNMTSIKTGAFQDKLRADIRFAQNLAMTRNRRARINFNGTNGSPNPGYAVQIDGSVAGDCSNFALASDPAGGGNLTVTLGSGTYSDITSVAASVNCFEYDSLGRPYSCAAAPPPCSQNLIAADATADVNGDTSKRVKITVQTGAVN